MRIPCEADVSFVWTEDAATEEPWPTTTFRTVFAQHFKDWYRDGSWTLSLGFSPVALLDGVLPVYCITQVAAYRLQPEGAAVIGIRGGPNEFEREAAAALRTFSWGSVAADIASFRSGTGWSLDIIEENAQVAARSLDTITPADARYSHAVEFAAAKAAKDIADLWARVVGAQSEHAIENRYFTIKAHRFGQDIRLDWRISDEVEEKRLLGFRKEGGFHSDPWAQAPENGSLEVDSREKEGHVAQHLIPGRTYYFTFYIAPWQERRLFSAEPKTVAHPDAVARFQIRVPSAEELRLSAASLSDIVASGTPRAPSGQVSDELARLRDLLKKSYQLNRGKAEILNEIRRDIAGSPLPDTDKSLVERLVEAEAERLWDSRARGR